jgi:hypothetical protein
MNVCMCLYKVGAGSFFQMHSVCLFTVSEFIYYLNHVLVLAIIKQYIITNIV